MRRGYSLAGQTIALAIALTVPAGGQVPTGRISGTVLDPAGHPLGNVVVGLAGPNNAEAAMPPAGSDGAAPGTRSTTSSDEDGRFAFDAVAAGAYVLTAAFEGYLANRTTVQVDGVSAVEVQLTLALVSVAEVVDVVGSTGAGDPLEQDRFQQSFLRVFQLPADRFQEALPLLPGVVRDPRGRISFNGARPNQSALLVNGANATDPVTGRFAAELPLSAVETIEVHQIPYSAEFGRVSGAVANVQTAAGDDHWGIGARSVVPTPRFRDGRIHGISRATPRVTVSGPIRPGRAWLRQSLSYRFVRSRIKEEVVGDDEEISEGVDVFTQVDLNLANRHALTGTVSFFRSDVKNLGLDSLRQAPATPELESHGWNLALADTVAESAGVAWKLLIALRGYDVAVRPKANGPARLTPDGLTGNYFSHIERESRQAEVHVERIADWTWRGSTHLTKVGTEVLWTSFDGFDRSGPIEVRDAQGRLLRRTTFQGDGLVRGSDVLASAYVQDHWRVHPRFALDLGLRYDRDSMLTESHFAPRAAFAFDLTPDGRTRLKGGYGVFFDRVLLQVDGFGGFQRRVEQKFDTDGVPLGTPIEFENRVVEDDFDLPKSRVWNLELDRQISQHLMLRLNYRENRARDRHVVDRVIDPDGAALVLSSTGRLTGREFDATLRWTPSPESELFASFSKIRTRGDTNDFATLYDNERSPLLFANEQALQPFDAPNRLLVWGILRMRGGVTLTPGIEWRDGFPYSIYTEDYAVVGSQNDSRLPPFLSIDLQVSKPVRLLGRNLDLGVQVYNLTGHDNPRDAVSNLASTSYGAFRNSVGRGFSLKIGGGF